MSQDHKFSVGDRVRVTFPERGDTKATERPAEVKECRERNGRPAYLVLVEGSNYMIEVWEPALERRIRFREFL